MQLQDVSIHAWITENEIKNERGELIDFHDHLYLFDIYADMSKELCVMKAAQVGMSVAEVMRLFWLANKQKLDLIYTLPTDEEVQVFVGGKVNRIIAQNPILQAWCKDKDSIFQKAVGESMIYFRSTFSKKKATMITADGLIHDEKDSSNQEVIEFYQSRLQHSKIKMKHSFSHPSLPSFGVHTDWLKSDQKHWIITCPSCEKNQFMDWPASVCLVRRVFQCKYCKDELPDEARRCGRWKKRFPSRKISGYWVPLLICPWVKAGEIIDKWEDPESGEEYFFNMVLGKPFQSKDASITRNDIMRNVTSAINSQAGGIVIGCDSGKIKHYVVGNAEGIFYYGKTETWDDIAALLHTYPKAVAVLDALPDLTGPQQLQEAFPGRVFVTYYNEDRKSKKIVRWSKNDEEGVVHVDRNRMITRLADEMKDRRVPLQGQVQEWEPYVKHWMNVYRVKDGEDKQGKPVFRWMKKSTEDHWVHATLYWRVGMTKFGGEIKMFTAAENNGAFTERTVHINPDGTSKAVDPETFFVFEQDEDDDDIDYS